MSTIKLATFSSKGQLVIPKSTRERLQFGAGDIVELHEDGNTLIIKKHPMPKPPKPKMDKRKWLPTKLDPRTGIRVIQMPKGFVDPGDVDWEKIMT